MDFLAFRWMLTPRLMIGAWWVLAAASIIGGWVMIFSGNVALGLVLVFGGPIVTRLVCELLIVTFAIHSALMDIRAVVSRLEVVHEWEPDRAPVP